MKKIKLKAFLASVMVLLMLVNMFPSYVLADIVTEPEKWYVGSELSIDRHIIFGENKMATDGKENRGLQYLIDNNIASTFYVTTGDDTVNYADLASNGKEISVTFHTSSPVIVDHFKIVSGADTYNANYAHRSPTKWNLKAGNSADECNTVLAADLPVKATVADEVNAYEFDNSTPYQYYKFTITALAGAGKASHDAPYPNPTATCLLKDIAIGGPEPIITVNPEDINFTNWESSTSLPTEASDYRLETDVTISSRWDVPSGTTNLDLNGHSITRTNASDTTGSVIQVGSGATLNLFDSGKQTRYYTVANPSANGAGLGTVVSESEYNAADENARGTFTGGYITGGVISGAADGNHLIGGGVNVDCGTFTMYGGTIIGNKVCINAGGVKVRGKGASFTMNGGGIIANYNDCYGGAISIGDNNAGNTGSVTINGGTIARNWSGRNGGGFHPDGNGHAIKITGGSIVNNYTAGYYDNNSSGRSGGGIIKDGTPIKLSGTPVIKNNMNGGNVPNNINFRNATDFLTLSGGLKNGADIGVYYKGLTASSDFKVATGAAKKEIKYVHYDIPSEGCIVFCDGENDWVYLDGEIVEMVGTHHTHEAGTIWACASLPVAGVTTDGTVAYTDFNTAKSAWSDGSTLKLYSDVTTSSTITIPSGEFTLDLNGRGIKKTGDGRAITVNNGGSLTVNDSDSSAKHYFEVSDHLATNINDASGTYSFAGGYITGGNANGGDTESQRGGGVFVYNGGTFTMNGGTLIGNKSTNIGAGLCSSPLNVSNNTSVLNLNAGSRIMYNATPSNAAGGIYASGNVNLNGVQITNNYAAANQIGGVNFNGKGTVTMSGATVIRENYSGEKVSNFGIEKTLQIGEITEGAYIGMYSTSGYYGVNDGGAFTTNNGKDYIQYFHVDSSREGTYMLGATTDGALRMGKKNTVTWNNYDDSNLDTDVLFTGDIPTYDGVEPQKLHDEYYVYTFSGWSDGTSIYTVSDTLPAVSGDVTYKAVYSQVSTHSHDEIGFDAWTSTNSLPTTAGDYYLTNDVTISGTWTVPSGTTNLCLNGHGIRMTGNSSAITVNSGATLKLYDCDTATEHRFTVSNAQSNGAGFATVNDSLTSNYKTFTGGYITGGKGTRVSSWSEGGALYIDGGTVEMYGGTIIGNGQHGTTHGGGFVTRNSATFKMYGGSIQNNAGLCGGATRLKGGVCEIRGGKIINNIVSGDGAGIHVGGTIPVILKDCEISGNYAGGGPGAGIWMSNTGTEISGSTVIENNVNNVGTSNVEVANGCVFSVGELTTGAKIGVLMKSGTGVFTSGWSDNMAGKEPENYFTSDNEDYTIILNGNEAEVAENSIFEGKGTEAQPYLIQSADDWNALSDFVNSGGTRYNGKYFKLTKNITVTKPIGNRPDGSSDNNDNPFVGTFDGDGHTITANIDEPIFAAPFGVANNATIKNLNVTGTIRSSNNHAAGLVAASKGKRLADDGTLTIQNVTVSADISCNSHIAGIVGHAHKSNITMENVVFKGSLNASSIQGGFIGWGGISGNGFDATFKDCLFLGTYRSDASFYPVAFYSGQGSVTLLNDFYTTSLGGGGNPIIPTGDGQVKLLIATVKKDGNVKYFDSIATAADSSNWTAGSTLSLAADVTTSSTITVPSGEHTLDLNGHSITYTGTTNVIASTNGTLILNDSDARPIHYYYIDPTTNLGVVTDSQEAAIAGNAEKNGSFRGGYITGGKGAANPKVGGGIYFTGGSITMNGGTIIGNSSDFGGGVQVRYSTTFTMKGGAIIGNTGNGGAVNADGNSSRKSKVVINSGRIVHNTSGIRIGTTGSSALSISGNIEICDNTDCDVKLLETMNLTISGAISNTKPIVVKTESPRVFTSGWSTYMSGKEPDGYFASYDEYCDIVLENGEARSKYREITGVTATGYTGDYDGEAHTIDVDAPEGTTIKYGTEEGSYSLDEAPSYTDAGTYTVYFEVSKEKYLSYYGSKTVTISPIDLSVTITGHTTTVDYNGNAHSADGYDAVASSELYDVTKDFTYSGRAQAVRTDAGTTQMNLDADDFANTNSNFATVTFNVTDGYVTVSPIDVTVTITGHNDSMDYDGKEHSVTGYDAVAGSDLYDVTNDFTFSGTAEAKRTNAGTTNMGLEAAQFENTNPNFATVTFDITDGYITVNPIPATVTITGHKKTVNYNGKSQSVQGYNATVDTELYDVKKDFVFSGNKSVSRTDAGTTNLGLSAEQFENINSNFRDVTFVVNDGYIKVNPIDTVVTIVGHNDTAAYNGKAHTVSGYDATASSDLYDVSKDFTFSGTDEVSRTDTGTTEMGLDAAQFENTNPNFANVTFEVTDGFIKVKPIDVVVTITGHNETVDYDGTEHTVKGYDAVASSDLYDVDKDFTFSGKADVARTDAGTTEMGLNAAQFENTNPNFATVAFEVTDGYVEIKPIDVTVTITGNSETADYDGTEHTVKGYEAVASSELYNVDKDFTFNGKAEAARADAGTTEMGLDAAQFENTNSNFANVTFDVTDGFVKIKPIDVTVTITGNSETADYDGKEHTVKGYDAVASSDLYDVDKDFTFSGKADVARTDAGTTEMGLDAAQFENTNGNFANVTFEVTDGYVTIKPIDITVTITGHSTTVDYNGNAHSADGYDAVASNKLYDVTKDFTFSGRAEAVRSDVGTTQMNLDANKFENTNPNFANVTFEVTDGYVTIKPIDVTVTITGHSETVDFDGKEHTVKGYDAVASSELYDVDKDFTFSGKAEAARTESGTTKMGLDAAQFENTNPNFENVTFEVTDGFIEVKSANVVVTITGHKDTVEYDGKEHTVKGYDAVSNSELYDVTKDFTFSGKAEAARTESGTTKMGLKAAQFENTNSNFANVKFEVTDGYVEIKPIDVTVTITGHSETVNYDGTKHTVKGYDAVSSSELYNVDKDFSFNGKAEATRTDAGTTKMGLEAAQFENTNSNFANVTFEVADGYVTVNPIDVTVTITGHTDSADYNGKEHSVKGYDATASSELYDVDKDITFNGKAEAARTDVGTTNMGLEATQFENANPNFKAVTFDVTDGYVTVKPIDVTVTITGHTSTVGYNGKEHTVKGYDAKASTTLYDVAKDFVFSGNATASQTDAGTAKMGLAATQFENVNGNFNNVTFVVTDGYQKVTTVDAVITKKPQSKKKLVYTGSKQTLITAGTAKGGTLYYALGKNAKTAPADKQFKKALPEAKKVGNYYIWYKVKADSNHNDLSPVCFKVTLAEEEWVTVGGKVTQENSSKPISGAEIVLKSGNKVIDKITTDENGEYYFSAPAGVYNVVVTNGNTTETIMIDTYQDKKHNLEISGGNNKSLVNVDSQDDDFAVVVGGLEKETQSIRKAEKITDDKDLSVLMTVEAKTKETANNSESFDKLTTNSSFRFFDVTLEKTVDSKSTTLKSSENVLEIAVPYEKIGRRDLAVYYCDGSEVKKLKRSTSKEAGTYSIDRENKVIYIYANEFATFAIGYTPHYKVTSSVSLGSFKGNVSVVIKEKNGERTFKLDNISADEISFDDIPKGEYEMTVTWVDGATNKLTVPITVS